MENNAFVSKLSSLATQVVILLNMSFNMNGDEKDCVDELLVEKAAILRDALVSTAPQPLNPPTKNPSTSDEPQYLIATDTDDEGNETGLWTICRQHPDGTSDALMDFHSRGKAEHVLALWKADLLAEQADPAPNYPELEKDTLSRRIQFARESLGLHEEELARLIDTYSDHVNNWECGITEPSASMIVSLAGVFKCDPLWLLTGNDGTTGKSLTNGDAAAAPADHSFSAIPAAPRTPICYPAPQPVTLGTRIQMCRESVGLSRGWIAAQLGVKPKAISMWEQGTGQPDINQVTRLATMFGVEPSWLAFDVIQEKAPQTDDNPVEVMQGSDFANIGKRINKARVEKGLSHHDLAELLNVSEGEVFLWETGKHLPPSKYIDKIAAMLQCRITWLIAGKEPMQTEKVD